MVQFKLSFLVIVCCLLMSCFHLSNKANNSPGDKFMPHDMVIFSYQNLLDEDSQISKYCDRTFSSFSSIESLAITDSNDLFIITNYHDIIKINNKGNPQLTISSHGQGPGEMQLPASIKVRNNKLYVLDIGNNKILIYSTYGVWLHDIVFRDIVLKTFEVDKNGNIIIPNIDLLKDSNAPLFLFYNDKGKIVKKISKNKFIKEDLVTFPCHPLLFLTPNSTLILLFKIQGVLYNFNFDGEVLSNFDIQGGPEWIQSVKYEKELEKKSKYGKSWPYRVENVSFDSKGNIYATWGGDFKGEKSIAMIYDSNGHFIGRLFGNEDFPFAPTCFLVQNDSTIWMHCRELYTFSKCKITRRKSE